MKLLPFESLEARVLFASTRVAVIGDFSSDVQTAPTRDVANLVQSWSPDAVVTVGDNNYPDGEASTIDQNIGQWYHSFIAPYKGNYGAGSSDGVNRFWPALGNHDWNTPGAQPYVDYFTLPGNERYYSKQIDNVGLFIVDSDPNEPDGVTSTSTQGQWLKSALATSTATWKLVFFHHPAFSSGEQGSTDYMQWPFQAWGASAVFQGHDHDYERIVRNNFPYFVDGLGGESRRSFPDIVTGSQVRYVDDYGAMKLDATDTTLTCQFITRGGEVIDTYMLNAASGPPPTTILPAGSTWKYLDNGSNQGTAWRATAFNDSAWKSGAAQLGYGDGDEATVIGYGSDSSNKFLTSYFRKSFNVSDPASIAALNLNLLRDDGAVVYLNGTEIFRSNMPSGTIAYNTPADEAIEDETYYAASIDPSRLVAGSNVLAVEVHQADAASSDVSFDLSLRATMSNGGPSLPAAPTNLVAAAKSSSQIQITWADNATNETGYRIERSTDGVNFAEVAQSLGNVTSFIDSSLAAGIKYYYRVRAYNAAGSSGYSNVSSATTETGGTTNSVTYIPVGSTWKYLDNGTNQGTAWRAIGFNDSTWKSGDAELGYGDGDEKTVVGYGSDASNKFITTYFRKTFTVADASKISTAMLRILRDDGAVVYLNGTEIFRTNMDPGTVGYRTPADVAIEDSTFYPSSINPSLFVTGTNVIAVEVHQADLPSSDISFNFGLDATINA
jgi:hypothetical protein